MATKTTEKRPQTGRAGIGARKFTFLALAFVIFGATVWTLDSFNLLPNGTPGASGSTDATTSVSSAETAAVGELPTTISIPAINLMATVANPDTTDTTVLDNDLKHGAVRYPGSGTLGVPNTNVVLFGHSSYLPVVHNLAFKTFDGIQTLKAGDQIVVTSTTHTYVYAVETVAKASVNTDAGVPLTVSGQQLTLVTCDSFTTKTDRFVVIANLVDSRALSQPSAG